MIPTFWVKINSFAVCYYREVGRNKNAKTSEKSNACNKLLVVVDQLKHFYEKCED